MAQDYLENITCPLGKGIIRDPAALTCQHTFCRLCLEEALAIKSQCPICGGPANSIMPQIAVAELINAAAVKCAQCGWEGHYSEYEEHERKCSSPTLSPCPIGCGVNLLQSQIEEHLQVCRLRKVSCKDCKAVITYHESLVHQTMCPEKSIECPNKCGMKIKQGDKPIHFAICKGPKSTCVLGFAGCHFVEGGGLGEKTVAEHYKGNMVKHLELMGAAVYKLKTKIEVLDKYSLAVSSTKQKESYNLSWSTGKKIVSGDKSGWSFYLSNDSIAKNFMARVRIATVGNDSNTWKICLGLFNTNKFQIGSWEKHRNGYGYILGTGNKVHEGGAQSYGKPYEAGEIIGIENREGNITFYRNQTSQGLAYSRIPGPFYLAVALSDPSHSVEILDVVELD